MSAMPISASYFLSTLGVETHISWPDAFTSYANLSNVVADLNYLGINQIRDGVTNGQDGFATLATWESLATDGIHITSGVPQDQWTTSSLASYVSLVAELNTAVPGSVTAVEGANEVANWPVTFNGVGGEQGAVAMQEALYADVHSNSGLAGVPVYIFTTGNGTLEGPNPATTPGVADYNNAHPYPFGWQPPASSMDFGPSNEPGAWVYTETGYNNTGGTYANVNADVQAKYTLDLLMDAANDGVSKTFLYQLMDSPGDVGWGLFNTSNQPTEAATAIHNLTTILADPGTGGVAPTALNDTITGLPSTGNSMVIEKSNGTFDIAVWNEPNIWNPTTGTEITAASVGVTVNFGATYSSVEVFDPLVGSAPIATYNNISSVQLSLTDHPEIIQLVGVETSGSGSSGSSGGSHHSHSYG